ncbi:glycosyltransferase [Christiangramia aquimixticola]|uniref:glycosyltransferase n=1 Tax=Christiangramia aquimixticola TaxID=1697558 RepID=UPI003AA89A2B
MKDLISIIIPCYNDAENISESIDSAINQDYGNIEVIVVDDGSDQNTKNVLRNLEPKIAKLITQKNKGASSARNVGIQNSTGKYILNLDSDDSFDRTFVTKAMSIIQNDSNIKIVSSYINRISENRSTILKHKNSDIKSFLKYNHSSGSALFKRSDWLKVGGYDEKMTSGYEDWDFYIRLLKGGGVSYIIPEPLLNYRIRPESNSTRANKMKYHLLRYIYIKHKDLYIEHYEVFVDHLLSRLEVVEKAERKNWTKLEFRLGKKILDPIRKIKDVFKL